MTTKKLLIISLVIHLVSAFFSTGFHHYDEHFCVMEFTSSKLGTTPTAALNDHYQIKMRPWFLSGVFFAVLKTLHTIGIKDPFIGIFFLRLISALLGWFATCLMIWLIPRFISDEKARQWTALLFVFYWLFPYVHSRPAAEHWSGSLFFIGLGLCLLKKPTDWLFLVTGLLWGLAFETRFQAGILVFGAGLWVLFLSGFKLRFKAEVFIGILAALLLGRALDIWGYGEWTLSPWNYLNWQVIQGNVNNWGVVSPSHFLEQLLVKGGLPTSIFLYLALALSWFYFPKNPFTWACVPFVLVHFMIGHKEERFMFPMILAIPMAFGMAYEKLKPKLEKIPKAAIKITLFLCFLSNALYMVYALFFPLREEIGMYRYIYHHVSGPVFYAEEKFNPFRLAGGIPVGFYRPQNLTLQEIPKELPFIYWLFLDLRQPSSQKILSQTQNCSLVYDTIPAFLRTPRFEYWIMKAKLVNWQLFHCSPSGP